jgi:hypothetical protein
MMDTLADHLERLRRRLLSTARGVKGARALMHDIYGVGPLSSLASCAWLGGADRFSSSRKAVRFVGLDITVHSSDGKRSPGRLSRQGPEVLRWLLFEAAKTSARSGAPGYGYYTQVKPLRREPGLPVAGPPDRPAGHAHPGRPRRRRIYRCRSTGRTHDHRPLNHDADTRDEDRQSAITDDGHQSRPAPPDALSDRATTDSPPMTADGQERLSGRTPARGPPDQSSCRGRNLVRRP